MAAYSAIKCIVAVGLAYCIFFGIDAGVHFFSRLVRGATTEPELIAPAANFVEYRGISDVVNIDLLALPISA